MKILALYWKHALVFSAGSVLRWILHVTKTLAADFEREALRSVFRWLLMKGRTKMYSKIIPLGEAGSVTVSEGNGVASVAFEVKGALGAGKADSVLKGKACVELELSDVQAADLAFAVLEAKFPSLTAMLEASRAEVDALLKM